MNKKDTFMKKTGFKFCPKCKSADLMDNPNNIVCNSCGYKLYFNAAAATSCIIERDNKILFVVRKNEPRKGSFDLPGGFVDFSETLEQGMKRELLEEIGYCPNKLTYFASFPNQYEYASVLYHTMDCFFTGKIEHDTKVIASDDAESIEWINIEDIELDKLSFNSVKNAITSFIKQSNFTIS